jgi:hypothetical protein
VIKEIPVNVKAVLRKPVGNASASALLETIVFWCTRKKGGVEYQGRVWSYRQQKDWIELTGLAESTGKRSWARLVEGGFILTEMRKRIHFGVRVTIMHVALTDNTYELLGGTHLGMAAAKAELAIKDHAKVAQKEKAMAAYATEKMTWEETMADPAD